MRTGSSPSTLSLGANYQLKYTRNSYTDDVDAINRLHNQYVYGFAQLKGCLGALTYVAGLGVSNQRYTQGEAHYNFNLFRPQATLAYNFGHGLSLSYDFKQYGFFSRIAMIGDATIRTNGREWTMGSPNLKPNRCDEHTLRFNYFSPRWNNTLMADYRDHSHATWLRISVLTITGLSILSVTSGASGCYTSPTTSLTLSSRSVLWPMSTEVSSATSTLATTTPMCITFGWWAEAWKLISDVGRLRHKPTMATAFSEGENLGWNYGIPALQCSYQAGPCSVSLTWDHCFMANPKAISSHLLNRYMHKDYELRSKTIGNFVSLNFTWKLTHGRSYKEDSASSTTKIRRRGSSGE